VVRAMGVLHDAATAGCRPIPGLGRGALPAVAGRQLKDDVALLCGTLLEQRARPVSRKVVDDDDLLVDWRRLDAIDQLEDGVTFVEAGNDDRCAQCDGWQGIGGQRWQVAHPRSSSCRPFMCRGERRGTWRR